MTDVLPGWGSDFGGWLRREREARGVPLAEVAQQTRIHLRWLELLEQNRTEELPAEVFVRGFASCYARAIGADEKEVNRLLTRHYGERSGLITTTGKATCLPRRPIACLGEQVPVALGVVALLAAIALVVAFLF